MPAKSLPTAMLDSLFMVIVGTGLGGGAVLSGRAIQGSQGRAGHVGHILLPDYAFRYEHDRKLLKGNAYCDGRVGRVAQRARASARIPADAPEWTDHSLNKSQRHDPRQIEGAARAGGRRRSAGTGTVRRSGPRPRHHDALGQLSRRLRSPGDRRRRLRSRTASPRALPRLAEAEYHRHALDGFRNLDRFAFSVCGDDAPVVGALAWAMSAG